MQLDICHLMAMITQWPSLKEKDKLRRFYKNDASQKANQISNLEDLSYFIKSILVVSFSKCIRLSINDEPLPSVEWLKFFLNDKIRGIQSKNDDGINTKINEEKEFDVGKNLEENKVMKGWKLWSDQLYTKAALNIADQSIDGDMINACYNVDFTKKLTKYLLPYALLWINIIVPIFRRGSVTTTSAAIESEFSDLKNSDFRDEISMRIDRFVLQHLQYR